MNAVVLVVELATAGVELWIEGDTLRYRGDVNAVTVERVTLLRQHKDEILSLLCDPHALRELAAEVIFDAEPEDVAAGLQAEFEAMPGLVRCVACRFERNVNIPVCPVCHPAAWLPSGCLARTLCSVLGPCPRRAVGRPCRVAVPNERRTSA